MATFYDTHAHLDYPDYEKDLPEVIARAQAAGITKMISIGTSLSSSERAIRLAGKFPSVYAAVGWHPSEAMKAPSDLRPALREFARHPKVVALGETGLDYHHLPCSQGGTAEDDERYKARQADIFQQQLEVAIEFGLNCIIHQRNAFDETLAQLKPLAGKVRGVFHCFGESADRMRQVLASARWSASPALSRSKTARTSATPWPPRRSTSSCWRPIARISRPCRIAANAANPPT